MGPGLESYKGQVPHPHSLSEGSLSERVSISRMYRLQGKHFFFTYSQCDFDIDLYNDWLRERLPRTYVGAVICRELHADGGNHRHVALEVSSRFDTRNPRFFDYEGIHGNYQAARTWRAVLNYVKKTEDWKGYGEYEGLETEETETDEAERFRGKPSDIFKIAREVGREEFVTWCVNKRISAAYCTMVWDMVHNPRKLTIYDGDVDVPGAITVPHLQFLRFDESSRKALILQGPTGIGKTTWAILRAPKPCMVVTHLDELRNMPSYVRCLIFDDMDFRHMPRQTQLYLVDFDLPRKIHVRYGTADVPAGMFKIFTCNDSCFPFVEDSAIRRRIEHVIL